jgi:hypothetical protein
MRVPSLWTGTAAVAMAAAAVVAVAKDEFKPTVRFARSWEAAVKEARELNVPIVVHSHGFY